MNKIICDNQECKAEIQITKDLIETKHLSGGIQINFFRCGKCGDKTLIDVTNGETRDKQIRYSYMIKKIGVMLKQVNKENLETMGTEISEEQNKAEQLLKEIKAAKAELKKKYEGIS